MEIKKQIAIAVVLLFLVISTYAGAQTGDPAVDSPVTVEESAPAQAVAVPAETPVEAQAPAAEETAAPAVEPVAEDGPEASPAPTEAEKASTPAEPSPTDAATATEPVQLTGDSIEYKADEAKFEASGNVVLRQNNAVLFADKLEFYREKKEAHATGNIILESEQGTVWADKAFYNFDEKKGEFTNARIMADPFYGRAASITKVRDNYYVLSNGWLSTSDYDDPEYRIKSRKIEIYPGSKAVARSSTMYLGGLPVMYLPKYTQDLRENRPHFSVIPGYKKDFGGYLLTKYRVRPMDHLETTYHVDYRERKDLGWGVDFKIDPPEGSRTLLRTYYMNERSIGSKRIWDDRTTPTTERERYRVELRHLWDLDPNTNFIGQYYKLSDSEFLKKYFESEYRQDQEPPTYAVLTHNMPKATASLRTDVRVNRFQTTVERLPEANLTFSNQPIADTGFYVKSVNTASNLTYKTARPSDSQYRTQRVDSDNELSRPFKLSIFEMRPYVGTEQTYYSRGLTRPYDDTIRSIFRTGMDVTTKFYKAWDTQYDRYGIKINKLRHIVTPTVGYIYQHWPSLTSENLFQYDTIDNRTKLHRFDYGINSTFQTKRDGKSVDLLRTLLTTGYRLHDDPAGGDHVADYSLTNEFIPNDYFSLYQDATYDAERHHLQSLNFDIYVRDKKKWEFAVGRRYALEEDDLLTTQLSYKFNPKWRTVIYDRWNIDRGIWQEQSYALVRDLHSWEVEFAFNDKKGYTDSSSEVWLVFRIKAFPEFAVSGSSTYQRRAVGSGSTE